METASLKKEILMLKFEVSHLYQLSKVREYYLTHPRLNVLKCKKWIVVIARRIFMCTRSEIFKTPGTEYTY